jgi:hypothetical protein
MATKVICKTNLIISKDGYNAAIIQKGSILTIGEDISHADAARFMESGEELQIVPEPDDQGAGPKAQGAGSEVQEEPEEQATGPMPQGAEEPDDQGAGPTAQGAEGPVVEKPIEAVNSETVEEPEAEELFKEPETASKKPGSRKATK